MIPAIVSARCGSIAGAVVAAALTTLVSTGAATQPAAPACPARPMPAISSRTPADVCIPDGFTGIALQGIDGVKLWSKAGWTSTTRHDAAYLEMPDGARFVLVTFTTDHASERDIIPTVARVVIDGLKDVK